MNLSDFQSDVFVLVVVKGSCSRYGFKGVLYLPSAPQIEHVEVELNFCHHGDPDKDL